MHFSGSPVRPTGLSGPNVKHHSFACHFFEHPLGVPRTAVKRVTIKDIAREARVSPATVSNVLNGRRDQVSDRTADAILHLAKELGYRKSKTHRRLAQIGTETLGLYVDGLASSLFAAAVYGAETSAARFGYSVLLCSAHERDGRDSAPLFRLLERQVDGIIFILQSNHGAHSVVQAAAAAQKPLVVINHLSDPAEGFHLLVDNEDATYQAARHLITMGHRRVGHIHVPSRGPMARLAATERVRGFERAVTDHSLEIAPEWIREGVWGDEPGAVNVGYQLGLEMLSSANRPSAIVCDSDTLAAGVMDAAHALGLSIPRDLALTGFDDAPFAPYLRPPLTTVHQPMEAAGAQAAETVIQSLWKGSIPTGVERLPCRLVVRASSTPA